MARLLLSRVIGLVVTLWGVVTAAFFVFRLVPGNPAVYIAGTDASQATIKVLENQLGLTHPLFQQYLSYLGGLFRGNLGTSVVFGSHLASALFSRYPVTLELAFEATALALVVGVTGGVVAALRRGSLIDRALMALVVSAGGLPTFWLGVMLIALFATGLHLVPVSGGAGFGGSVLADVTLAAYPAAIVARMLRSSLVEVMGSGFILACRARGFSSYRVLAHALRNALAPTFVMTGLLLGYLLGGSIVVEDVFTKQGIGLLLLQSIDAHDYEMVQAITMVFSASFLVLNFAVDLGLQQLDPRTRLRLGRG